MKQFGAFFGLPLGFLAFVACSAGSNGTSSGLTGGNGGSSASAGSGIGAVNAGGSSASGGSSGSAAGGTGGMIMVSGSSGDTSTAGSGTVCNPLMATSTVLVPTIELLVDTSSSMWETMPPAWPILYSALMDPSAGALAQLQDKIRFGFASYKGLTGTNATSETEMACATMTTVPPDLDNHDAIDAAYKAIGDGYKQGDKWETPTNYAINYAVNVLSTYNPMPAGPKYILLVTDGNPNTCQTLDPQCGQDYAIKAAQDAFAAGVGLFILGIGDIVTSPNNGCPSSARCGMNHLQDMANAGVGAGVQPPPGCDDPTSTGCQFKYESCNKGNLLTAAYTPGAPATGTPFSVDTSAAGAEAALTTKLATLLSNAASCTFDLDAIVTGNAALGNVSLDGTPLTYGDTAAGWALEDNKYQVTLQGSACDTYRSGPGHQVDVSFPCDMGKPIAEPR